ncbi:hypothetical protein MBLNU459_g0179t1 [Dothideomycetes sp. NU459]
MSSPPKTAATGSERRRSSQAGLFGNLMAQKRGADNEAYSQRRASLEEQGASSGAFGKLWNNVMKPAHSPTEGKNPLK